MREVPEEQTFGVCAVDGATLRVPIASIGVKCGWFGGELAHVVVVADADNSMLGAVVTTSRPSDMTSRRACELAAGDDAKLAAIHEQFAGYSIRSAVGRALEFAASL
jgi:hypothetical protein